MVSDLAFGITLALAIFFFLVIAGIIVMMKKKFSPDMMKILSTLHASLFGYEQALIDMIGPRGYRTHVYPEVIKVLTTLKDTNGQINQIFTAKTPLEGMQKMTQAIMDAKVIFGATVEEADGGYKISIPNCSMCNPIHTIIGEKKGICPMALIVSSAANIVNPNLEPLISYSEFTPVGTVTTLKFKEKSAEEQK